MKKYELTLVFEHESTLAQAVWRLIAEYLVKFQLNESFYSVLDRRVAFESIDSIVANSGRPHFGVEGQIFVFSLTRVGTFCHDAIRIQGGGATNWNAWVQQLKSCGKFVQAFLVDCEYHFWQNATDQNTYKAFDRSCDHLPKKSNGLPFPLERQIIDISKNPGRQVLHDGFIEVVASPMWLGKTFWKYTGADINLIKAFDKVTVEFVDDVVIIVSSPQPFNESSDKQLLVMLRSLLFPVQRQA